MAAAVMAIVEPSAIAGSHYFEPTYGAVIFGWLPRFFLRNCGAVARDNR